jgi:hypothetical protein
MSRERIPADQQVLAGGLDHGAGEIVRRREPAWRRGRQDSGPRDRSQLR